MYPTRFCFVWQERFNCRGRGRGRGGWKANFRREGREHVPCRIWFNGTDDGCMHIQRKREREIGRGTSGIGDGQCRRVGRGGRETIRLGQRNVTMVRMVRMARMVLFWVVACLVCFCWQPSPKVLLVLLLCFFFFWLDSESPVRADGAFWWRWGEGGTREFIFVRQW